MHAVLIPIVQEGVRERKVGIITRAEQPRAESGIRPWRNFSLAMIAHDLQAENFCSDCSIIRLGGREAVALQTDDDSPIYRFDRVRGWGGSPVLHSRSWFHPRRLTGSEDFSRQPYDVLKSSTGVVADSAREEFSAVTAGAALAKRLLIKRGIPFLLRFNILFDARIRVIGYPESHHVSPHSKTSLDLRRDQP